MRLTSIFASVLLGASIGSFALAQPVEAGDDILERAFVLDARSLDLKVKEEPKKDAKCPDRIRVGNFGPYPEHTYTKNQIKVAFLGGAKLAADGKQVGDGKYPHDFGNAESLPFPCGKDKMEFPIQTDNKVYGGGDAGNIPDRVVFEYQKTKKDFIVKYCGVMRHGPARPFLKCD